MIEVQIEDEAWNDAVMDAPGVVTRAAAAALANVGADGDVVVLLTGDEALADLNARFRGKDGPTNVLSFAAPDSAGSHLGDIAIAYGVCTSEAFAGEKPLEHHLMHLTAHGVLHLLGYDHETDAEAEAMEARERDVLKGLGVPDPYETGLT